MSITTNNDLIESKKDLIKRTFCKGVSDDEFEMFLTLCKRTGLDPFMKQVYAIPRKDGKTGKTTITIQTSIDGFRLIADRSGNYSPGKEPKCDYNDKGQLISVTSYVKKRTADGTWHEVAASAFYDEYVQKYNDRPTKFWQQMPHVMLAKCAEALALRKAFPAELSGIYTSDEMQQADNAPANLTVDASGEIVSESEGVTDDQAKRLELLMSKIDDFDYLTKLNEYLESKNIFVPQDMNQKQYALIVEKIERKLNSKKEVVNGSTAVA